MRLGQLARQVGISQKDIVSFLQKEKDIELKVHPNVKVEDDLTNLIIKNFAKPDEEITEAEPMTASKAPKIEPSKAAAIEGFVEALKSKAWPFDVPEIESPAEIKEYTQGEELTRNRAINRKN